VKKLTYYIGRGSEQEHAHLDFKDGLSRSVEERIELGIVPLRLPLDDSPYRVFESMKDYRIWASRNLPKWLGYYIPDDYIIKSKRAAKRQRDREELPRLEAFQKELK
jgi:hypothetical protein